MFTFTSGRRALLALAVALSAGACANFPGGKCDSAGCAEDQRIRAEVEKQLNAQSSLRFFGIRVQTRDQVVYLEGAVDTRADQRRAEKIALAVPGVKKVENGLSLLGNGY